MAKKVSFDNVEHSLTAFVKYNTDDKIKKFLTFFQYNKESKHGITSDFTYSLLIKIIDKKYKDEMEIKESVLNYDTLEDLYADVKMMFRNGIIIEEGDFSPSIDVLTNRTGEDTINGISVIEFETENGKIYDFKNNGFSDTVISTLSKLVRKVSSDTIKKYTIYKLNSDIELNDIYTKVDDVIEYETSPLEDVEKKLKNDKSFGSELEADKENKKSEIEAAKVERENKKSESIKARAEKQVLSLSKAIDKVDMQGYKKLNFDNFDKEMKADYPEKYKDTPEFKKVLKTYWRNLNGLRGESYYNTEDGAEFLIEFYTNFFNTYYTLNEGTIVFKEQILKESVNPISYRNLRIKEDNKEEFIVENFYFEMKKFGDLSAINNCNNVNYTNLIEYIERFSGK